MVPEAAAESYVNRESRPGQEQPAEQQAATQPDSGTTVPAPQVSSESPTGTEGTLPFKTKVEAWAHIHHGTVTRNSEEKEHYQKVLAGERTPPPNEWKHN